MSWIISFDCFNQFCLFLLNTNIIDFNQDFYVFNPKQNSYMHLLISSICVELNIFFFIIDRDIQGCSMYSSSSIFVYIHQFLHHPYLSLFASFFMLERIIPCLIKHSLNNGSKTVYIVLLFLNMIF